MNINISPEIYVKECPFEDSLVNGILHLINLFYLPITPVAKIPTKKNVTLNCIKIITISFEL